MNQKTRPKTAPWDPIYMKLKSRQNSPIVTEIGTWLHLEGIDWEGAYGILEIFYILTLVLITQVCLCVCVYI